MKFTVKSVECENTPITNKTLKETGGELKLPFVSAAAEQNQGSDVYREADLICLCQVSVQAWVNAPRRTRPERNVDKHSGLPAGGVHLVPSSR